LTLSGLTELRLSVPEAGKRLLPLPVAVCHKDVGKRVLKPIVKATTSSCTDNRSSRVEKVSFSAHNGPYSRARAKPRRTGSGVPGTGQVARKGGYMPTSGPVFVEDAKVGVRLKISALWIVLLFLYAYGDIFGFFKPGRIEEIVSGQISGIDITEGFLFAVSVYVAIASVMIFLTLVLRPAAARWSNVVLAILYFVTIVGAAIGESAYYWFLSVLEIAVLALIVWYAWMWPREAEGTTTR
jgi:Family of unknown function (DUF6326)